MKKFLLSISAYALFSIVFISISNAASCPAINRGSHPYGLSYAAFNCYTDDTWLGRNFGGDNSEQNFVRVKKNEGEWSDNITLTSEDDYVNVLVYLHNSGVEGKYPANGVKIEMNWEDPTAISTIISANNINPKSVDDTTKVNTNGFLLVPEMITTKSGHVIGIPEKFTSKIINLTSPFQSSYKYASYLYITFSVKASPSININKIDANQTDLDGNIGNDTQTIIEGTKAVFKITVTNNGGEDLKNVIVTDKESSSCSRTAEQTLELYEGNTFDIGESFTYTCEKENVTSNTFVDGDNDIDVTGIGVDSGTKVNDEDPTKIIVNPGIASISVAKVDNNTEIDQDGVIGSNQENIEYDNETKTEFTAEDSQTIYRDEISKFKILVINNGNKSLTNVVLTDENAPDCNRTAAETRVLYEGNSFDPEESFSYECEKSNIQENYINQINVSANDEGNTIESSDRTEVIINPVRPGSFCGDGTVDTPNSNGENEECDDGNDIDNDQCNNLCQENDHYCGNGIIEEPEECDDGNDIDNDNCSNTCIDNNGGGGGGGPSSIPTIGTCITHSITGADQCANKKPYEFGPQWSEYHDCVEGNPAGFTVDETTPGITRAQKCSYAWGISQGFDLCGDTIAGGIDYFSNNENNIASCNPLPPLESGVTTEIGSCSGCFGAGTFIEKTADKSHIAKGDMVGYNLRLSFGLHDTIHYKVVDALVKFYDFTIPSENGNLWGRHGLSQGWTAADGGQRIQQHYGSSSAIIRGLNTAGGAEINVNYTMNSALAADADTASIDNVAFAVVDYTYREIGCDLTLNPNCGNLQARKVLIPGKGIDSKKALAVWKSQNQQASFSSLGDMVSVKIIRPFVKANNGGNLGFELEKGRTEKVTATEENNTDGTVFVEGGEVDESLFNFDGYTAIDNIDPLKSFQTEDIDKYYDNLRFNTIEIKSNGEVFDKTPIQEVYFYDGAELSFEGELNLNGKNKTYIIENGDLVIGKEGLKLKNGFAAFIVRNGDIIIHEDAKEIEGIFISEKGEIKSNAISKKQLKVSGALMGDLASLLNDRWYIGENPDVELEPNVEIEFDLRLLEETPPALEQFIGTDWQESVE